MHTCAHMLIYLKLCLLCDCIIAVIVDQLWANVGKAACSPQPCYCVCHPPALDPHPLKPKAPKFFLIIKAVLRSPPPRTDGRRDARCCGARLAGPADAAFCTGKPDPAAQPNLNPLDSRPPVHVRSVPNASLYHVGCPGEDCISSCTSGALRTQRGSRRDA